MDKPTPGPWRDDGHYNVASVAPYMVICEVRGTAGPAFAEGRANLRLIAVAPDLLAIAKKYASECSQCDGAGTLQFDDPDAGRAGDACPECSFIHAVIAKAEGPA